MSYWHFKDRITEVDAFCNQWRRSDDQDLSDFCFDADRIVQACYFVGLLPTLIKESSSPIYSLESHPRFDQFAQLLTEFLVVFDAIKMSQPNDDQVVQTFILRRKILNMSFRLIQTRDSSTRKL